jgi:hypothetical protein
LGSDAMPEAEVSLRIAFWLLDVRGGDRAEVAIDGAHVEIAEHQQQGQRVPARTVFDIRGFLREHHWVQQTGSDWRGTYARGRQLLSIRSVAGFDVQVFGASGGTTKVQCKGGPLVTVKGKGAGNILTSAVGQAVVSDSDGADHLMIAAPDSEGFERAAERIMNGRLFRMTGIQIALVGRENVRVLR